MANHHSIIPQADLPIGRFRIELRATLQILLPEETFTPRPIDCTTVDVSARGLKLCIENMPGELYLRVIRGIRHARISLNDDRLERPVRLDGQVVWVDYHQPDQDALP